MATLVGEIRDTEETALSFKPEGPHIQINSISIEISSGEINGAVEECNHFSIRGFVREQRKKDSRVCSPFMSDNKISSSPPELPPLDVHKCKWWRCSGCLQDCNSSSNSKDEIERSLVRRARNKFLQNQETGSAGGGGNSDYQRSAAKGKQLVEEEGLLIRDVDYSQGGAKDSFSTEDAFSAEGLDCFGPHQSSAALNKLGTVGPPKSSSKQRSTTLPANSNKQNVRIWHKPAQTTTTPPAATTNYAIRSVQQPDSAAKGVRLRMPQRFIDAQVPPTPQLDRIQVCNYSSTTGRAVPERGQKLNSVVESNRLLKKPRTEVELEAAERNNMCVHLRRGPKIRLLSDVIADNVSMKRKADKAVAEQSAKRKSPPFVSPPGSWNKRKRSTVRFAEPEDRTTTPRYNRPGLDLSAQPAFTKNAFHTTEVQNNSNKTRVPSSVPSLPRHASRDHCEMPLTSHCFSFGQAHGGQATDGARDKSNKNILYKRIQSFGEKISFPPIGRDYQPATQLLQTGPENAPGRGTFIIGGGLARSDAEENFENSSTRSSSMTDYLKTSVSTGNDLRISQVQARGTLVERKGGEVSSCTQQIGVTGRVKDIDINSIPVDDKAPELGAADDIPMDIVELLAKLHEHERHSDANRENLSVEEEVSGGEKSSGQKSNSSCLLKPQASYSFSFSYANNGVGRPFDPILTAEKKIQSDQSRKSGCPNDDPLALGAQISGGAVKSWNGNKGPFRPALRLQPATQSLFNRPPPPHTQTWMPGSISSSRVVAPDVGHLGMYMTTHSQLNIGNPKPSSSATQSWTYPEYAAAAAVANGRQNITHQFVLPLKETIPAMQLLNLVQVAGSSTRRSKFPFGNLDNHHQYNNSKKKKPPPYAPRPHFEPYNNKPTSSTAAAAAAACTFRQRLYDGEGSGRSSSLVDILSPCSSAQMFASSPVSQNDLAPGTSMIHPVSFDNKTTKPKPVPDAKNAAIPTQGAQICVTNRNPAEMILDSKQVMNFMISPEDLCRRRKPTIPPKPRTV